MKPSILKLCEELSKDIKAAYESNVTPLEAERFAAKFLHAQLTLSGELHIVDLDCRMKKSGLKATKASVYMSAATGEGQKDFKKPSDPFLQNVVDLSELTEAAQKLHDHAENDRDALVNYLSVFKEAHIYFRALMKGING